MLMPPGAGGPTLQVSVPQSTIDSGSGRASLSLPAVTKRFSLRPNAARTCCDAAAGWHSITFGTGILTWNSVKIMDRLCEGLHGN